MGKRIRGWSRLAFCLALGVGQLAACSSDRSDPKEQTKNTGKLSLALEATAPSGRTYRLRDAFFEIIDLRSGSTAAFVSSEDFPANAREISTIVLTGNYTVRLHEGWFIERVDSGGGTGGTAGTTAGTAGIAGAIGIGGEGTGDDDDFPFAGFAGDDGTGGVSGKGGSGGRGGTTAGRGGAPSTGGTGSSSGTRVDAHLLSDALQFFQLFGGDEAFIVYTFQIGGEVIDFTRGRVRIGIDIIEDPSVCVPPDGVLDPERVLMEVNTQALANIDLLSVLDALGRNEGMNENGLDLYHQIVDSYATADQGRLASAIHCGDETTGGVPTLNGYPIECNRIERFQFDNLSEFFPTAFVNRLDLMPQNGAHCGQQRVIFANNAQNRMFMILEAQIPNPHPELGTEGCVPLARFWAEQNDISDPFERGIRLSEAFLFGSPELAEFGFGPFYTATNLTVGSGQIRTNQFDQSPWTLREFKLAENGEEVVAVPFPTAEAPNGALWNENSGLPQGAECRENFLSALDGLLTDDPAQMSFVVDQACKDAESRNDFSQDYSSQLSQGFREELEARLVGTGLDADDIANRAQFAGSCIGCHEEAAGRFLGRNVFAPFSNGFVHVQEFAVECQNGSFCFQPSPALRNTFLPSRLQVLGQILDEPIIDDPCDNTGGTSGSGGFGGTFTTGGNGMGGAVIAGGAGGRMGFGGSGVAGAGPGGAMNAGGRFGGMAGAATTGGRAAGGAPSMDAGAPAPAVELELPPSDEPVDDMQEHDAEIREQYGEKTVSGRSARSTH
jgi:hypothetical protein